MPDKTNKLLVLKGGDPEARFVGLGGSGQFWSAPDLEEIGEALIKEYFPDFPECEIDYLWKGDGGRSGGKATLGKTEKPSGLTLYYGNTDYVIWLAADHVGGLEFTNWQVEALLYHELCHVREEEDENGNKKLAIAPHDFEGFASEIERYGFWEHDSRRIAKAVQGRLELGEDPSAGVDAVVQRVKRTRKSLTVAVGGEVGDEEPDDLPVLD